MKGIYRNVCSLYLVCGYNSTWKKWTHFLLSFYISSCLFHSYLLTKVFEERNAAEKELFYVSACTRFFNSFLYGTYSVCSVCSTKCKIKTESKFPSNTKLRKKEKGNCFSIKGSFVWSAYQTILCHYQTKGLNLEIAYRKV